MDYRSSANFPPAAVEWLAPRQPGPVLAIGRSSAATGERLRQRGHEVTLVDRAAAGARAARHRYGHLHTVAGSAEALPFLAHQFAGVVVSQGLHQLAPGLALAEFARVLAPGGQLSVLYTVRDDSVPWVRRLADILQAYDPKAMTGGGAEVAAVAAVEASGHFPVVESRDFRLWVPITRDAMLELVAGSPNLAALDPDDHAHLLAQVGDLYDGAARQPEPLLLPYALRCWRAQVDHTELTSGFARPDLGLRLGLWRSPHETG